MELEKVSEAEKFHSRVLYDCTINQKTANISTHVIVAYDLLDYLPVQR